MKIISHLVLKAYEPKNDKHLEAGINSALFFK